MDNYVILSVNLVLMIVIVVVGRILQKVGRPYDVAPMAVHKLAGVAFAVYNGYIYYSQFSDPASGISTAAAVMIVVAIIGLFASGALLIEGEYTISMKWLHRLFTLILLAGMAVIFKNSILN
jgi:hypothetical protein